MPSTQDRRYRDINSVARHFRQEDLAWKKDAACQGLSVEEGRIFFADIGRGVNFRFAILEAKELCGECPVQVECLEYALAADERGIWGGLTYEERLKLPGRRDRRRFQAL